MPVIDEIDNGIWLNELVHTLFRELRCLLTVEDGQIDLWHYTSGQALIDILTSRTIFSTHVACLNDRSEVRYYERLLRDAILDLDSSKQSEELRQLIAKYIEALADDSDGPGTQKSFHFVSCFSEKQDDLSQWRAYGGGENGIAIRFKARNLIGTKTALARVNYDAAEHKRLAKYAAEKAVEYFTRALENEVPENYMGAWAESLSYVAPLAKYPGFESETEIRIVYPFEGDYKHLVVRQRRSMMSTHYPLELPFGRHPDALLPIEEIMIGPSRHQSVTAVSVNSLLTSKGYPPDSVLISKSKRPYQET